MKPTSGREVGSHLGTTIWIWMAYWFSRTADIPHWMSIYVGVTAIISTVTVLMKLGALLVSKGQE